MSQDYIHGSRPVLESLSPQATRPRIHAIARTARVASVVESTTMGDSMGAGDAAAGSKIFVGGLDRTVDEGAREPRPRDAMRCDDRGGIRSPRPRPRARATARTMRLTTTAMDDARARRRCRSKLFLAIWTGGRGAPTRRARDARPRRCARRLDVVSISRRVGFSSLMFIFGRSRPVVMGLDGWMDRSRRRARETDGDDDATRTRRCW